MGTRVLLRIFCTVKKSLLTVVVDDDMDRVGFISRLRQEVLLDRNLTRWQFVWTAIVSVYTGTPLCLRIAREMKPACYKASLVCQNLDVCRPLIAIHLSFWWLHGVDLILRSDICMLGLDAI